MKATLSALLPFTLLATLLLPALPPWGSWRSDDALSELEAIPELAPFVATGLGEPHPDAPVETAQFGQLVGVWEAEQEMRTQDGGWMTVGHGLWVWKYTLQGFAVEDLWFQSAEELPLYLAGLGRAYLLGSRRIFDARSGRWHVAWMTNAAGQTPGSDFGTFSAQLEQDRLVMTAPVDPSYGAQRVIFSHITADSFRWQSEYARDGGEDWQASMRMTMNRLD